MSSPSQGSKLPIQHDPISVSLSLLNVILFVFMSLGGGLNPTLSNYSIIALVFTITGLLLPGFGGIFVIFKQFSRKALFDVKQWVYVLAVLIVVIAGNLYIPSFPLGVSPANFSSNQFLQTVFLTQMAISEELFFRMLLGNLSVIALGKFAGSLADGALGTVYHIFVYGAQPVNLIIVFLAFTAYCFVDVETHKVSTSMIDHILNNYLASPLSTQGTSQAISVSSKTVFKILSIIHV